jgi:hypothetical protein
MPPCWRGQRGVRCEPMPKKLRCYLGFHRWHTVNVKGGNRYTQCSDCGKVRLPEDLPPLDMAGGTGT